MVHLAQDTGQPGGPSRDAARLRQAVGAARRLLRRTPVWELLGTAVATKG